MSDTERGARTTAGTGRIPRARGEEMAAEQPTVTGWVGWIMFAGAMLVILGVFQAIWGLAALFNSGYYIVGSNDLVLQMNYTAWGWTHLAVGVLAVLIGGALLAGQKWARVVAVLLAGLSAIANFLSIGAYPVWAMIMIAIDILVIYAIAVHGKEMEEARV